ncbi:Flp pilus assembly complex ATPase component TadA (plasmid) [Lysinibacillus sphaericus]|uniref:ATPase, T2SS/T4P/T4SS family n=1 Tax=Lysinibacillus sphaericus TaxID=1421 RepID=UPI00226D3A41|nr:ATPase, T2SS/T4P/T4SS family [Lysinibacillus sphaericus]UDK94850.1 Flp pilus assembly complex ATPase component TadA [Lysinibacillus sphaericus]
MHIETEGLIIIEARGEVALKHLELLKNVEENRAFRINTNTWNNQRLESILNGLNGGLKMNDQELQEKRINEILDKSFLVPLLKIESITDVKFNGTHLRIQDNEKGRYLAPDQPSEEMVKTLIKQIADVQKSTFTYIEPQLDTEIGILRISATHRRISPDGTTLAVRISRPRLAIESIGNIISGDYKDIEQLFKVLMLAENNLVIAGRTGSGKTEFQKLLVGYTADDSNIVLIEDTRDSHIKALYPEKIFRVGKLYLDYSKCQMVYKQDYVIIQIG